MKVQVTKDTLIGDMLQLDRGIGVILMQSGMGCVGCLAAKGESVEQAAAVHGIDVDFLIEKLNEVAE